MNDSVWTLIGLAAVMMIVIAGLSMISQHYTLNIKSRTVGDGQHGTARWATKREIRRTYHLVRYDPQAWRHGDDLPKVQGIIAGSIGKKPVPLQFKVGKKKITVHTEKLPMQKRRCMKAIVDGDDIHCLMFGPSGIGKTAFFLYPNLEYACATGMSFLALDSKGDLARNYATIAKKYYDYRVSVIDLRNPTRSDGDSLLTLINRYSDKAREQPDNLAYKAKAEKYAKILAKTIINQGGESGQFGDNAYFYDAAEGALAAMTLLLSEFLPPQKGEADVRHIISVFKLTQDLLAPSPADKGKNGFQALMDLLPPTHKARWLAAPPSMPRTRPWPPSCPRSCPDSMRFWIPRWNRCSVLITRLTQRRLRQKGALFFWFCRRRTGQRTLWQHSCSKTCQMSCSPLRTGTGES